MEKLNKAIDNMLLEFIDSGMKQYEGKKTDTLTKKVYLVTIKETGKKK